MFFLLYKHTDYGVFDDFPKISDHFPTISEDFPKLFRGPDERSRKFSENFRTLLKAFEEDPRMNLSTILATYLISVKSSISSLERIWKIHHPSPVCSFV